MKNVYFKITAKCMKCQLHFVIYTYNREYHTQANLGCPECYSRGEVITGSREKKVGFIFEETHL
jgi:Zn finger protein HypA/HybF involved in hydrogenase expression